MKFTLPKRIFVSGFMATGKSRLAQLMSVSLSWKFIDTDNLIEKEAGLSITEIFKTKGEEYFRDLEKKILSQVLTEENVVIALGGGALKNSGVIEMIKPAGILVGLWATPETILTRVKRKNTRPLLANLNDEEKLDKINSLIDERKDLYNQADFQIESREDIPHHALIRRILSRIQIECVNPLTVNLQDRSYPIYIHDRMDEHLGAVMEKNNCPNEYVIATDSHLKIHQREALKKLSRSLGRGRIFYFRPGEKEKNLSSINRLISYMLKQKYSRKTVLIAFGGGVVGDMVGFAASIYLRGIPFIQIPTTLLAMVDSSVGGKTGVNHRLGKNLIGAFYQPKAVMIGTQVLSTLPDEEYKAGLAEVIKYAIIWDGSFFEFLKNNSQDILNKNPDSLEKVIQKCCEIKAEVVAQDERESGLRAILNYGHTFGHAIENLSRYSSITHGLAVSLGMRVAMRLSMLLGKVSSEDEKSQNELLNLFAMPKHYEVDIESAWEIMSVDKKVDGGNRIYILPDKIGKVSRIQNVDKTLVTQAWEVIKPT